MGKKVKITGSILICILIILTFLSRSVFNYNTVKVKGVMPTKDVLKKRTSVSGNVDWAEKKTLFNQIDGIVDEVFVKENQIIKKGDVIATLRYDTEDLLAEIARMEIERERKNLEIASIKLQLEKNGKESGTLSGEVNSAEEVSNSEIETLQTKLNDAKEKLEKTQFLYESGIVPFVDVEKDKTEITQIEADLKKAEASYKKQVLEANKNANEKEKTKNKELERLAYENKTSNQSMKEKQLDIKDIDFRIDQAKKKIEKITSNDKIISETDGTIISLEVKQGQTVTKGQEIMKVGIGNTLTVEVEVDKKNNFVMQNDIAKLRTINTKTEGTVTKVISASSVKKVTVLFESDIIKAGETLEVTFDKTSGNKLTVVPNSCLFKDTKGYYVYTISERDGMLGKEYYLSKVQVTTGDSDANNTEITSGFTFFDPLVELTDKPVTEGMTVKLTNEGDLFAK